MPPAWPQPDPRLPGAPQAGWWRHGAVMAAAVAALVLALYWQLWTPRAEARMALRWDALWEYWGDLQIQVRALARGQWPLWQPFERLGYPFYADPQAGTLYPGQWPLVAAGRAMGAVPYWLIVIKQLAHLWLLGLGMALWLRRQGLATAACYLGALLLLTSYAVVVNAPTALTWSFAYAPWLLLAGERLLATPRLREGLVFGVVAALMIAAGAMGAAWYAFVIAGPWLAWCFGKQLARAPSLAYARAVGLAVAAAGVLVVGLCGTQAWATLEVLPHTERALRGPDFFTRSGMTWRDLVNLVVPGRTGLPIFLGWVPLGLAIVAAFTAPRGRSAVWLALWVVGIVFALGDATPVLRWAASVMPPIGMFRMAHRYLYVAAFAFAVLAAWGLHGVWAWVAASPTWQRLARGLVVGALLLTGAEQYGARRAVVAGGMVAVPVLAHDGEVAALTARHPEARVYDRGWLGYRPGARLERRDFGGYEDDPLALRRYARVRNWVRADPNRGGRVGLAFMGLDAATSRRWPFVPRATSLRERAPGWFAYQAVAPQAWWTPAAEVAPDAAAAFARFAEAGDGEVLAVVEAAHASRVPTSRASGASGAPAAVPAAMAWLTPHVVQYRVRAPATGLLVASELYVERGWTAVVNGAPAPIAAINGYARGVTVPAGEVTVTMTFGRPGFVAAAVATCAAWLLVLAWLGWAGLRQAGARIRATNR